MRDGDGMRGSRWIHRRWRLFRKGWDSPTSGRGHQLVIPGKLLRGVLIVFSAEHLTFCSNYLLLQLIKGCHFHWLNCGEILRKICQEMPSACHFQSVLKTPHRAVFSPSLSWLTDLFGSFWVPGTGLQKCAAGGDYTRDGSGICWSFIPTATSAIPIQRAFWRGEKSANSWLFLPPGFPKTMCPATET